MGKVQKDDQVISTNGQMDIKSSVDGQKGVKAD